MPPREPSSDLSDDARAQLEAFVSAHRKAFWNSKKSTFSRGSVRKESLKDWKNDELWTGKRSCEAALQYTSTSFEAREIVVPKYPRGANRRIQYLLNTITDEMKRRSLPAGSVSKSANCIVVAASAHGSAQQDPDEEERSPATSFDVCDDPMFTPISETPVSTQVTALSPAEQSAEEDFDKASFEENFQSAVTYSLNRGQKITDFLRSQGDENAQLNYLASVSGKSKISDEKLMVWHDDVHFALTLRQMKISSEDDNDSDCRNSFSRTITQMKEVRTTLQTAVNNRKASATQASDISTSLTT